MIIFSSGHLLGMSDIYRNNTGCKGEKETILFDINETVLELNTLQSRFMAVFGHEKALSIWFSSLLHSSTVCIVTKVQTNFAKLSAAMLDALAVRFNVSLSKKQRSELLSGFASLQPYSDIKPALAKLRLHGFRIVAFSNSSMDLMSTQIKNAGLSDDFDVINSVEETSRFKPDPLVYRFVAEKLGEPLGALRLVATHDWDTHGALSAGLKAAYIDRSGVPYNPFYLCPDICSTSMERIVEQIIDISNENQS